MFGSPKTQGQPARAARVVSFGRSAKVTAPNGTHLAGPTEAERIQVQEYAQRQFGRQSGNKVNVHDFTEQLASVRPLAHGTPR